LRRCVLCAFLAESPRSPVRRFTPPDDLRGIDRAMGAMVVVRPDQYVSNVLALEASLLRQAMDLLSAPGWCLGMLRTSHRGFGNVIGYARGVTDLASFAKWHANQFVMDIDWKQGERLKTMWGGPLIVKGVLDAEDALLAIEAGADALSVSNQGGRQSGSTPLVNEEMLELPLR
jgi:isopentenyl diphosphate isomerase/L-lactate dehydrogenase-like FMN-dependent dehydrogenase